MKQGSGRTARVAGLRSAPLQEPSKRVRGQAPGLPSQLETEESELRKTEIFTTYFIRTRTHTCALWKGFQQPLKTYHGRSASRVPHSPLPDPGEPNSPLKYCQCILGAAFSPPSFRDEGEKRLGAGERGWTVFYFLYSLQSSACGVVYRGRRAGLISSALVLLEQKFVYSFILAQCSS